MKKRTVGFKESVTYLLDLLCYAYYCKADNIVSDKTFDELEKIYCILCDEQYAPNRANEREHCYSKGVAFLYGELKRRINDNK